MAQVSKSSLPLAPSTLLTTESQDQFDAFASAMLEHIKPEDIIEEVYVRDVIDNSWHVARLRWCRTTLINIEFRNALVQLFVELGIYSDGVTGEVIADKWFSSKTTRDEIAGLLKKYNLDETSISAEAVKLIGPELATLGREIEVSEKNRNRALRKLEKRRASLAKRARTVSQRLIDADDGLKFDPKKAAE